MPFGGPVRAQTSGGNGLAPSTRARFTMVSATAAFFIGVTLIVLGQLGRDSTPLGTHPSQTLYNVQTSLSISNSNRNLEATDKSDFNKGELLVDTTVVDTPSTILLRETERLHRIELTFSEDFPQLQREAYLTFVSKVAGSPKWTVEMEKQLRSFHPSLIAWATVRYKVANVPYKGATIPTNSANEEGKAFATKYLRYPNGPPSLYQYYSPAELNLLYASYAHWATKPEEREEWGRWSPATQASPSELIPPILDYAHVACPSKGGLIESATFGALLGRTRISMVIESPSRCLPYLQLEGKSPLLHLPRTAPKPDKEHMVGGLKSDLVSSPPSRRILKAQWRSKINQWLFIHAPSWYVAQLDLSGFGDAATGGRISLRRRVKAFHFAVTGGSDRRASYVEHTWGQRTPMVWFGDSWVPSIRPLLSASQHSKYLADKFGLLSFKMSRVWEVIYRDYYCGSYAGAYVADATDKLLVGSSTSRHNISAMRLFDASLDPITYDDQVGDSFVPMPPSKCLPIVRRSADKTSIVRARSATYYSRLVRFGPRRVLTAMLATASAFPSFAATTSPYDWYIRLWDDNYYFEENLYNIVGRMDSDRTKVMIGKIGWRNMGANAVYPFAGGGAGWFLSKAGMGVVGPSFAPPGLSKRHSDHEDEVVVPPPPPPPYDPSTLNPELSGEEWFIAFRDRKDIFMKHGLHNEDVFLTAWFAINNITMWNVPGVEHVSPGMWPKQRCMSDLALFRLRWEGWAVGDVGKAPFAGDQAEAGAENTYTSLYYDYPVTDPKFLLEKQHYSYAKPLVWHYMSPSRLVGLERTLYAEMLAEPSATTYTPIWGPPTLTLPKTASDKGPSAAKLKKKTCYAGVPLVTKEPNSNKWERGEVPAAGSSVFEKLLPDPELA